MLKFASWLIALIIVGFSQFITAVRGIWVGIEPDTHQRVYFANHASMGDFILLWTVLPAHIRRTTRPVAGADYWLKSKLRSFVGADVFNAVLIDRNKDTHTKDPVAIMVEALDNDDSLILFPEGTRNTTDARLLPFKTGLYHLAKARPDVDLVPVWIENLRRVLPKGEIVPIPFICTVTFGAPIRIGLDEGKQGFLKRAESEMLALAPESGDQT